jgi:hypothetical protein
MRPLALAARLGRRPRLLAAASLLVAGATAGCIAGEPIAPASIGAIPGRYVLTMFSSGIDSDSLPVLAYRTEDGFPVYIRYATIDMYDDSTYVEVFELHKMNVAGTAVLSTSWDVGSGTWSMSGADIVYKAILRPALLPASTTWTGYQGTGGGPYALNLRRQTEPQKSMHYRRY